MTQSMLWDPSLTRKVLRFTATKPIALSLCFQVLLSCSSAAAQACGVDKHEMTLLRSASALGGKAVPE